MSVLHFISSLKESGFSFVANGPDLVVNPASQLSEQERQFIRQNKADILAFLIQKQKPINTDLFVEIYTPIGRQLIVKAQSPEHAAKLRHWNPAPDKSVFLPRDSHDH